MRLFRRFFNELRNINRKYKESKTLEAKKELTERLKKCLLDRIDSLGDSYFNYYPKQFYGSAEYTLKRRESKYILYKEAGVVNYKLLGPFNRDATIDLKTDDVNFIMLYGLENYVIKINLDRSEQIDVDKYINNLNEKFPTESFTIEKRIFDIEALYGLVVNISSVLCYFNKKQEELEERKWRYKFNSKNSHSNDYNIQFYSYNHSYYVNGIPFDSVTTFVNNAFPKYNSDYHAKRKAEQLGITKEEVLAIWEQKGKESRDLGTTMHSKIENYFLGNDSAETDAYKLFKIYVNAVELKPYRTEWAVYDLEHKIAGTIDFVDYQNGEYIIYDWKRSDKIIENGIPIKINKYGEKGNYPLEHLDNTPYYHYALQLSLYKYILEKNYGIKISDLRLGIFHPTYNKPYVLRMPYLEKEINDIFSLRSDILF